MVYERHFEIHRGIGNLAPALPPPITYGRKAVRYAHYGFAPPAAKCACATSSPVEASIEVLRSRGSSALENVARSNRRFVRWSRQACRIRGLTVLQQEGRRAAPVFHGSASDVGLQISRGGAAPRLRASD